MQLDVRVLAPEDDARWDALVESSEQGTVFAQRWWIEAATGGQGQRLGCFTGDRLLSGLPVWSTTMFGIRRLRQPPLTPYWGPIFGKLDGGYTTQLNTQMSILRAFAEVLLPWPDITMQWHPSVMNWLPFFWQGYTQTTRYTYRVERLREFPLHDDGFQKSVRQKLRSARQRALTVQDDVAVETVTGMFLRTMARQGMSGDSEVLTAWSRLAPAARAHGCLFTTAVLDDEGNAHTARAMVWDARCAYALFGGSDPRFRQSGAAPYSLIHEMQVAAELVSAYDFEGSTIEPIEAFFRSFGGALTPYFLITRRASWALNAARTMRGWSRRRRSAASSEPPSLVTGAAA